MRLGGGEIVICGHLFYPERIVYLDSCRAVGQEVLDPYVDSPGETCSATRERYSEDC